MFYLVSCNIGEILIIFLGTLFWRMSPLTAIQLLWLNLVTDGAPALALATEKGDPDIMDQKPRPPKEPIINKTMLRSTLVVSITVTIVVLVAFYIGKFTDPAHAEIKRQTDIFHRAQVNSKANILSFIKSGVQVYDIVDYNFPLYSFVDSYKTCNGDGLIHLDSESIGATSGYINTPLPAGYVQKDTNCSNPGKHDHISPDGIVDASTGLLPETTFYFYNQDHEGTGRNDVIMKLAIELLLNENFIDIHSMPERFPQFNVGRETKGLRTDLLPSAKRIDQSTLAAADAAELQAAIDQCEKMLATTVVVYKEFTDAQTRLENIMIKIGARTAPKEDKTEKYAKPICKFLSDALYKYWGPRGFSDRKVK